MPAGVRSSEHGIDLAAASRDCWPGGTLEAWQGGFAPLPAKVWWPEDEAQIVEVLRAASRAGIPVVTYGAGSGVSGGARGMAGSWVLDTKALARIGPLDPERWTVRVQAGVNGQQLEDWLNARGFTLGHSPSSIACSTVGGWAAARSAGQFSSRYGVFEDMVLSARVVSPGRGALVLGEGGEGSDADLALFLGSEGTLGVFTELTLRVWPVPASRWLRGYRMPDVATAIGAMRGLMQGELHPAVVRLYDPVDTRIGGKTKPKKAGARGGNAGFLRAWLESADRLDAVRRRTLALPLALPGLLNRLLDGIASGCLLVVGWEGDPQVVEASSAEGHRLLCAAGEDLGAEPGERWFASRHAVSYKLMPIFERGGFADTMEVACRWSTLEATYRAVRAAVSPTAVIMAHMSHVYPEGGSIYFSFAGRGDREVYRRTWEAALRAVLDSGATTTHHHGVGELKARAASEEVGPAIAGWRAAKAAHDPAGVLLPGRLFVEVPWREPPPEPPLRPEDGLGACAPGATGSERSGSEPTWPVDRLPGPPRWQRLPWQQPWIGVEGSVEGRPCRLGRGPRSAAGPDLRPWLLANGASRVTFGVAAPGDRWMGEATLPAPARVARELLRSDLRPAALEIRGSRLRVGFRGPAARRLGELASARVPGGLEPVPWAVEPVPGALEPCDDADPAAVHVTPQSAFRVAGRVP